jgi:hypothetical protein
VRVASYPLYGLAVETELALPCKPAAAVSRPVVRIAPGDNARFDALERQWSCQASPAWCQFHRTEDGEFYLRWSGLFSFLVSADGHDVQFRPLADVPTESLVTYLLGQVLSFPLLTFGFEPLHATAVVVEDEAIAFVGDCGRGKSTLAAALVARGRPILTDDLLVLEWHQGRWMAHPGIPRLKLFPGVARHVLGRHSPGVPMNKRTSKLVIPLAPEKAVTRAVPLKAVYVLPEPGARSSAPTGIDPMNGAEAFLEVIRAAFNLQVLDRERLATQFVFAERVAATVPVRRLTYRRSLAALPAVCEAILADAGLVRASPMRTATAKRRGPRISSSTI